ncbi:MAG: hypothetical protein AAFS10_00815, partial [Myxococcota bacterium]
MQLSHSPTLSHRWVGRGQHSGHPCEVLFVAHPDELGPLLTEDAASWGAQTVQHGTWTALVFSTVHLTPLSARIAPPDLNDPHR